MGTFTSKLLPHEKPFAYAITFMQLLLVRTGKLLCPTPAGHIPNPKA